MGKRASRRPRRVEGIVLLEVLISVLVLAFGVLGIIGLQAAAIQHTTAAKYRTDASFIANARVGEIWARPGALSTFGESGTDVSAAFPGASLPNGKRTTTIAGERVTVTVTWQAPGADRASNVVVVAHIVGI
ncbi:hypothetical protein [Thauera phenylacetica]|uniref:Type IV pilus modification protein PilV n=1 Tax=Thauera phenylacetica B4P TaxID=1234382 RepID=N6Z436_9RHOO|nr:hypothetical protein [Thauera phenylacetica]ENO98670.1 hypothetical protein C667_02633 [Thauera phenylacetica B4P]